MFLIKKGKKCSHSFKKNGGGYLSMLNPLKSNLKTLLLPYLIYSSKNYRQS